MKMMKNGIAMAAAALGLLAGKQELTGPEYRERPQPVMRRNPYQRGRTEAQRLAARTPDPERQAAAEAKRQRKQEKNLAIVKAGGAIAYQPKTTEA